MILRDTFRTINQINLQKFNKIIKLKIKKILRKIQIFK